MTDEVDKLIKILEDISLGDYSNDIMAFTTGGHSKRIQRIAEAVGMMMVKVETREFTLKLMVEQLQKLNETIKENTLQTVGSIAKALGARDKYTEGHAERVAAYSERLARRLGLSTKETHDIQVSGVLHDIGKIGFSDQVFENSDTKVSDEIFAEIRQHPTRTRQILQGLEFLGPAIDYAAAHHEKIDGTGYPDGLAGNQIPRGAKILAVADCFDAITTTRSYQAARSTEKALEILKEISGNHLDPFLVKTFSEEIRENGMEIKT